MIANLKPLPPIKLRLHRLWLRLGLTLLLSLGLALVTILLTTYSAHAAFRLLC